MYAAETMAREEYRRSRRARVLRQQKARRKMVFTFFLTLVVIFGIGTFFGTLLTRAKEPKGGPSYKYYTNVEIQSGDTLWSLADTYMDTEHYESRTDYMNEVMNINHMVTDCLVAGEKLIVPYYSPDQK